MQELGKLNLKINYKSNELERKMNFTINNKLIVLLTASNF